MTNEPDPPPPPMSEAMLDEQSLAALFNDIAELATVDEILLKAGPGRVDEGDSCSLDEAHRLIRDGEVRGVQIRYRHSGSHWWDTLMRTPDGVRLVRVKHDFA